MINQVYAVKLKMTQEFIGGKRTPITLLSVPSHEVVSERSIEKDGYKSLILGLGQAKKELKKPLAGFLKKMGVDIKPAKIKEVTFEGELGEDKKLNLESYLTPGTTVTVLGKSKGKGFAGVVKRWGFNTQPRTHGQSDRHRAPGSIGRGTTPGRILPGKKMPGHMGAENVSVRNLKIASFDSATGQLKVIGPVPGHNNGWVTIRITKPAATN